MSNQYFYRKVMSSLQLSLLIFLLLRPSKAGHSESKEYGFFWQITDIHLDANFSQQGDPLSMCHQKSNTTNQVSGPFGNYNCDAPWLLLKSAVDFLKAEKHPDIDFILWTGDNMPHISDEEFDDDKVNHQLQEITLYLKNNLVDAPILPTIGNHDSWPTYQVPFKIGKDKFYQDVLKTWKWMKLLTEKEQGQFLHGGYYTWSMSGGRLVIIVLNSAMWYFNNPLTNNVSDPADQFKWMKQQLRAARLHNRRVVVVSHIPPGFESEVAYYSSLHPNFNQQLVDIMNKYEDVIAAGIFGHEHTDTIKLVLQAKGALPIFLSPAITPWSYYVQRNPGLRLYKYRTSDFCMMDYWQYYLNLTEANQVNISNWELEYQFTSSYKLKDASGSSLRTMVQKLDSSPADLRLFRKHLTVNSNNFTTCNETCKMLTLCSITSLLNTSYSKCLLRDQSSPLVLEAEQYESGLKQAPFYWIIGTVIFGLAICVFTWVIYYRFNRSRRNGYHRFSDTVEIGEP